MPFLKSPVKIGNYNQKAGSNDNDTLYANGLEIIYGELEMTHFRSTVKAHIHQY